MVRYWTRREWETAYADGKGVSALSGGLILGNEFLEDANGSPLDGDEREAIRKTSNDLWQQMIIDSRAPLCWSKCGFNIRQWFIAHMEAQHPILQLCVSGWKSDYIGYRSYTYFIRNPARRAQAGFAPAGTRSVEDVEEVNEDADSNLVGISNPQSAKRPRIGMTSKPIAKGASAPKGGRRRAIPPSKLANAVKWQLPLLTCY